MTPVDEGKSQQGSAEQAGREQGAIRCDGGSPKGHGEGRKFDQAIEDADPGGAVPASAAKGEPAQQREEVEWPELGFAMGTDGAGEDNPLTARQTDDQHPEETPDEGRNDDGKQPKEPGEVSCGHQE